MASFRFVRTGVETCDDGNASNQTRVTTCVPASCGDGYVQTGVEQCDDGNHANDDGCTGACIVEFCGDGIQQASEECDDSNTTAGDGCGPTCLTECFDVDGDGYGSPGNLHCTAGPQPDCDDTDPARSPGNPEVCDGKDNDCDSVVPAVESDPDGDGLRSCADTCPGVPNAGPAPGCTTAPAGLGAWWPLDETAGSSSKGLVDGNDGAWIDGPSPILAGRVRSVSTASATTWRCRMLRR